MASLVKIAQISPPSGPGTSDTILNGIGSLVGKAWDATGGAVINHFQGAPDPASQALRNAIAAQHAQTAARADTQGIIDYGVKGLGVGAAGAGLMGLAGMLHRNARPLKAKAPGPAIIEVPYEDDREKRATSPFTSENPFAGAAALAAGTGGAFLGWKTVDGLLNQQRESSLQTDVAKAKQRFNQALMAQYGKVASEHSDLSQDLDNLYDSLEKVGWELPSMGQMGNAYGMFSLAAGAGSAALAYNLTKGRSKEELLRKAMARRARRSYESAPSEIYAVPVPATAAPEEMAA